MYYTEAEKQKNEQFQKSRKKYIGGSDIPMLLGIFDSPYLLYLDKTNIDYEKPFTNEQKERMYFGVKLEEITANAYSNKMNVSVSSEDLFHQHPKYPYLACNIDRWCGNQEYILECKNTESFKNPTQIQESHKAQCAYQSAIINACRDRLDAPPVKKVDIGLLVNGRKLIIFTYERDVEYEQHLIEKAKCFWQDHVVTNIPPAPISSDDADLQYNAPQPQSITGTDQIINTVSEMQLLEKGYSETKLQIDKCKCLIKSFMQNNSRLEDKNGKLLVTWNEYYRKDQKHRRFSLINKK